MGARYAVLSEEKAISPPKQEEPSKEVDPSEVEDGMEIIESTPSRPTPPSQHWIESFAQNLLPRNDHRSLSEDLRSRLNPTDSLNVKLVYVDLSIFNGLVQFIHNASSMNGSTSSTPKRQLEDSNGDLMMTPKKLKCSSMDSSPSSKMSIKEASPESKGRAPMTTWSKRETNGEVKSALEMSREANKAAFQSYVDSILVRREGDDAEEALHKAQIQEAERAVESAKQQVIDASKKETQIRKERSELEANVQQKLREFAKEELDAEEFFQLQQQRMMEVKSAE